MKNWISFILLIPVLAAGQSLSEVKLSNYKVNEIDEVIISPNASFAFNKHQWSVGPTLLYSFGDQVEERRGLKLSGIALGYENFMHDRESKLTLYYSVDLLFQRIKDEQNSQYFDIGSNSFVPNKIEQVANRIFLSSNFGVLLNLSDKLSLDQSIGMGLSSEFRKTTSTIEEFSDTFLNQRWLLKIGIRYKL